MLERGLRWGTAALLVVAACTPAPAERERVAGNARITSFAAAKRLARQIYQDHRETFYCGCAFTAERAVELGACGYVPLTKSKRASRIEWEHVVPAHAFGQSFAEWREGAPACTSAKGKAFRGRNCARKASREFRAMEADLYNLVPAIGELNASRKNYSMAEIDGEERRFGACDVEIAGRKIEPRPDIRGDIARIYFYMDAAYPGRGVVSRKNRRLFAAWAAADPVDEWECERARRIARHQGNVNPFVADECARAAAR